MIPALIRWEIEALLCFGLVNEEARAGHSSKLQPRDNGCEAILPPRAVPVLGPCPKPIGPKLAPLEPSWQVPATLQPQPPSTYVGTRDTRPTSSATPGDSANAPLLRPSVTAMVGPLAS